MHNTGKFWTACKFPWNCRKGHGTCRKAVAALDATRAYRPAYLCGNPVGWERYMVVLALRELTWYRLAAEHDRAFYKVHRVKRPEFNGAEQAQRAKDLAHLAERRRALAAIKTRYPDVPGAYRFDALTTA